MKRKTLAEQIEVMQAALDGKWIVRTNWVDGSYDCAYRICADYDNPEFDWGLFNYDVAPEPRHVYVVECVTVAGTRDLCQRAFPTHMAARNSYGVLPEGTRVVRFVEDLECQE